MGTLEYQYQPATHDDLLEAIRWAQNNLCLRDWTIALDTGPQIPRELMPGKDSDYEGLAKLWADRLRALIWIPLGNISVDNCNPIEVCLHEMVHILHESRGINDDELLTRIISPLFYKLYCTENNITTAQLK